MFEQLTASSAPRERRTVQASTAIAIHLLVILVAAQLTRSRAVAASVRALEHAVPLFTAPKPPPDEVPRHQPAPASARAAVAPPALAVAPVPLPANLPTALPPASATVPLWFGDRTDRGAIPSASPNPGGTVPADGVWSEAQLSEPARYLNGPAPRYPAALHRAGIEGIVLLRYIVGVDSLAEAESISVIQATRPEFIAPAIEAIRLARFAPGMWHGRPVRQLVEQHVRFSVGNR